METGLHLASSVPHAIKKAIRSETAKRIVPRAMMKLIRICNSRLRFAAGVRPLSELNGDRGRPINREYVNLFLHEVSSVIRGRCLEFQENTYTSRFGADRVRAIDILHKELGNPNATIVADLTKKNGIPSDPLIASSVRTCCTVSSTSKKWSLNCTES
jgi:hypothetical protein